MRAGRGLLKEKEDNLSGDDVREGLTAIVSVKLHDPQFEGQTKTKLGNPGIQGFVESTVNRAWRSSSRRTPPRRGPVITQGHLCRTRTRGRSQGT